MNGGKPDLQRTWITLRDFFALIAHVLKCLRGFMELAKPVINFQITNGDIYNYANKAQNPVGCRAPERGSETTQGDDLRTNQRDAL